MYIEDEIASRREAIEMYEKQYGCKDTDDINVCTRGQLPANTKNGQLILGMFRRSDLIILISGVITTVAILAFIPITTTAGTILALAPGIICGLLVMPIPYYHNVGQAGKLLPLQAYNA